MRSESNSKDNLELVHSLREALASRSKATLILDSGLVSGVIVDLNESGAGKNVSIMQANLLAEEMNIRLESVASSPATLRFYTSFGFFELYATATFIDSAVPLIQLSDFKKATKAEERRKFRSVLDQTPKSFVVISNGREKSIGSFEVVDLSSSAVGGILRLSKALDLTNCTLAGHISSGRSSLRIKDSEIIRFASVPTRERNISIYKVAVALQNKTSKMNGKERRRFSRVPHLRFDLLDIQSSLFVGQDIGVRVTDISTGGFSGLLVDDKEEVLLPVGCEILFKGLRGEVVHNQAYSIKVKWILDSDYSRKIWQETIAKLIGQHVEIRSYESQSTLTLLARSGIKSSDFINSYHTAKELLPSFGEIEKSGDPIVFRAVQRDEKGTLQTHIGSFKVADNLWFNGDLFGAQLEKNKSTKNFVKEYFERFIDFSKASRPYPKIISSWEKGHPYWKKLEDALENQGRHLLIAIASVFTMSPDIRLSFVSNKSKCECTMIESSDSKRISEILTAASEVGTAHFLTAFDFESDRFGSPVLRMLLEKGGYKFIRNYFHLELEGCEFLSVVSHMPEGLSPQRHQSAVWLICIAGIPNSEDVHRAVNYAVIAATETGTFPSIVRVVGKDLSALNDKDRVVILADPRIWEFAS